LGERPQSVFCVGALGIDNIMQEKYLSQKELEKRLGLKFKDRNVLVTFHPVTLEADTALEQFKILLSVLDEQKNTQVIFTYANADTSGLIINRCIEKYVRKNPEKAKAYPSLGRKRYLSLVRFVDAVVGNSSSGIIEAPSFRVGTINIGDRQKGRIRAQSVIDCKPNKAGIRRGFKKLYSSSFQRTLKTVKNPYGKGNAAKKIARIIKTYNLENILKKEFYDLKF